MSSTLFNSFLLTFHNQSFFLRNKIKTYFPVQCILQKKVQFCTQKNDEFEKSENCEEFKESSESKLQKLLDKSSPLKLSPEAENFWATMPYVKGTVFQGDVKETETRPKEKSSIFMFPGQGNQFVGMAENIIKYPVVKDMFEVASDILGYNLLKICQKGSEKKLDKTEYSQPAIFVCSLGAVEKLKQEVPWAIDSCTGVCGFSLGEMAALVFAGCFSFEKGIQLVKLRAEAMQSCSDMFPGGMMTVLFGKNGSLSQALMDAKQHCLEKGIDNPCCSVATDLFCGCKVIGGHVEALKFIMENGNKYKLKKFSKLPVSGAFHTDHMKEAAEVFKQILRKTEITDPLIKVYSNVYGTPYSNGNHIKKTLPNQIIRRVKWEQTVNNIFQGLDVDDYPYIFECGPGNSLSVVVKKMFKKASDLCYTVKI